ncbi:boron transporter 4-like protein [Tanacetum coccineum]
MGEVGEVLKKVHASFVESIPFRSIVIFTIIQIVYFLLCFGVTWIPVVGILFPVPFFLLNSIRQHALPKLFQLYHLRELDAAAYEEIMGSPSRAPSFNLREMDNVIRVNDEGDVSICDAEILDELTTSRGELKALQHTNTKEDQHIPKVRDPPRNSQLELFTIIPSITTNFYHELEELKLFGLIEVSIFLRNE